MNVTVCAKAHANIALIKYWGKKEEKLILPQHSSLSLTLDAFYTTTTVRFCPEYAQDKIYLDQQLLTGHAAQRVVDFLNLVRNQANQKLFAHVESKNHVPLAAGLASSSAAFAALACAASQAIGLQLDQRQLSILARKGSGSACRSIFGGLVVWQAGCDDQSSFAYPIEGLALDQFSLLIALVDDSTKPISSRTAMQKTVATSVYYPAWCTQSEQDLIAMKKSIQANDFSAVASLAEANALRMHATMLAAQPPFSYLTSATWALIQAIWAWRAQGLACYFTIDAGPNVKILVLNKQLTELMNCLTKEFPTLEIINAQAGPGVSSQLLNLESLA